GSLKLAAASDVASKNALWISAGDRTSRIPLPPPPAAALSIIGYPTLAAMEAASWTDATADVVPGTTGAPAVSAATRALVLVPIIRIEEAGGPTRTSPARSIASAKSAFSERKPYPG